jgi:glutathione S-transferase
MAGEHRSPEYLARPKGMAPVLLVDGDPVTENVAILLRFSERFPEARLLPKATAERDRLRVIEDLCSSRSSCGVTSSARNRLEAGGLA